MMVIVFAIYDSRAELYQQPFFMVHNGQAMREFENACKDEKSNFYQHPKDFKLVRLGTFDDSNGVLTSEPAVTLARAEDFRHVS